MASTSLLLFMSPMSTYSLCLGYKNDKDPDLGVENSFRGIRMSQAPSVAHTPLEGLPSYVKHC